MNIQKMGNLSVLLAAAGLQKRKEALVEEVMGKRMANQMIICLRKVVVVTSLEMASCSNKMRIIVQQNMGGIPSVTRSKSPNTLVVPYHQPCHLLGLARQLDKRAIFLISNIHKYQAPLILRA